MIKRSVTALLFLFVTFALQGQWAPSLADIDFSKSEISQAGPDSFYVRNVRLPDQTVSVTIALSDEGIWEITEIIPEGENIIPADVILDFATVQLSGDDTIEIDWIIYRGSILRGVLGLTGENITVSDMFSVRGPVRQADEYPKALSDLLQGTGTETSATELASLREEYEQKLAELTSRYNSVVSERDTLKADAQSIPGDRQALEAQIEKLKEEKASLEMLKDSLAAENVSLQSMVDSLRSADTAAMIPDRTVSVSESLVQSYIDKLDGLQAEIQALQTEVVSLENRLSSEMLAAAATVSQSLSDAGARGTAPSSSTGSQPDRTSSLEAQIADLRAENSLLTKQMQLLEEEIRSSFIRNGFIAMLRPTLTETVLTSFEPSDAQLGLWYVGEKSAKQLEKSMLFGKLILPVTQDDRPFLYSFKARSTDPDNEWVGLGLHIFVENVEKRGYGLGDSLLVWLTRDQEVYKNNYTYLQLYRSDDDVNMERMMDAVIQEPVTQFLRIEVLYQPVHQYITIAVNGEEKIRYKTWFGIEDGVQVALRSLGTAEFTDLSVITTE